MVGAIRMSKVVIICQTVNNILSLHVYLLDTVSVSDIRKVPLSWC